MKPYENEFLDLVEKHQSTLVKICRAYSASNEEARDLFQDVLVQLWKSFENFRGESSRYTWMYRVTLYTAMGYHKQSKKWQTESLERHHSLSMESHTDDHQDLYRAIQQLNPQDRALIILYLEERSYEEIAEIIGITANHVGVKLNRIKKKLRQFIETQSY